MLLALGFCLAFGIPRILAVSITASDLPECAIECYVNSGAEIQIPITDYEGQCRSGEFQVLLRKCAENTCNPEEYAFTEFHAKEYCSEFGVDIDHVLKEYKETASKEAQDETVGDGSLIDGSANDTQGSSTCSLCTASKTATGLVAATASATEKESVTGASATGSAAAESASASASVATSEGDVAVIRSGFGVVLGLVMAVGWIV